MFLNGKKDVDSHQMDRNQVAALQCAASLNLGL
jgi:hypothetical protein